MGKSRWVRIDQVEVDVETGTLSIGAGDLADIVLPHQRVLLAALEVAPAFPESSPQAIAQAINGLLHVRHRLTEDGIGDVVHGIRVWRATLNARESGERTRQLLRSWTGKSTPAGRVMRILSVWRLHTRGLSVAEIARALSVTPPTVRSDLRIAEVCRPNEGAPPGVDIATPEALANLDIIGLQAAMGKRSLAQMDDLIQRLEAEPVEME